MLTLLQWIGFLALIVGYWYLKTPRVSACCTMIGCISILTWATLISPIAWGIVALEVTVGLIALKNFTETLPPPKRSLDLDCDPRM